MPDYSIGELARLASVSPRTIRFYIEQGLLASPEPAGKKTRYTDEHLERIRAIRKLQAAHFPLADIRNRLNTFTADQISGIAEMVGPRHDHDSAVDYIREILEPTRAPTPLPASAPAYSMPVIGLRAMQAEAEPLPSMPAPAAAQPAAKPSSQPTETTSSTTRSQWERITLDPDVELHIRRPLTRHGNKRVERLIAIARELFKEEE